MINDRAQYRTRDREVSRLQRRPGRMVEPGTEIRFVMVRIGRKGERVFDQKRIQRQGQHEVDRGQSQAEQSDRCGPTYRHRGHHPEYPGLWLMLVSLNSRSMAKFQ